MVREEIIAYLGPDWDRTAALVRGALGSDIRLLDEVNRTLLAQGGKRVRPMVALLIAGAAGGRNGESLRAAAAAELLHNATLLHDDVVDGSDERHGRPTVMSVLGGPAAVLIGDFWLVKAMEVILDASRHSAAFTRIFSRTLSDLAEGEMLQLQKTGSCDTTEADYYRIIYNKTASLFEAAARAGAVSVGASDALIEASVSYARALGIAFQIRDDMLDYADGGHIGKPVGADLREQKITLPLLGALRAAPAEEAAVRAQVAGILEHPDYVEEVRAFVRRHDGLGYAWAELRRFIGEAVAALEAFPDTPDRRYLASLAHYVGERNV